MLILKNRIPVAVPQGLGRRRDGFCDPGRVAHWLRCVATGVASLVLAAAFISAAVGQDELSAAQSNAPVAEIPNALHLVPEDASFFVSSLNHDTQFKAFVKSRAFAELANMPLTQAMIDAFYAGFEEGSDQSFDEMRAQMEAALGEEQVDDLIRFGTDLVSHEMFVYGSADFSNLIDMAQEVAPGFDPEAFSSGDPSGDEMTKAYLLKLGEFLDKRGDEIKVPDLVIGFRVDDAELAQKHVEFLHAFVTLGLIGGDVPLPIRRGYRKAKVGDVEFLKLQLSGSLLQLDALAEDADEAVRPVLLKLAEQLRDEQIALAIGVLGDYLLISIGDSLEHLEELGKGQTLIEREEFAHLRQQADRPLAGVVYGSEAMAQAMGSQSISDRISDGIRSVRASNPDLGDRGDQMFTEIESILQEFGRDVESLQPEPAATVGLSFITEDGYESFQYHWAVSPMVDGSQSLSILEHVDGDPMFFAAGRSADPGRLYQVFSKLVKRFDPFFMKIAEEAEDEQDVQQFLQVREMLLPYLVELDESTRELLIPSIRDGQSAFVVDFKNASDNWGPAVPSGSQPLVLPEFAVVCAINDREKFAKAMGVYDEFARDMLNLIASQSGEDFPDEIALPQATSMELDGGATAYYYPAPQLEDLELDRAFRPNLLLSDNWAIYSLTLGHSERLLEAKSLPTSGPFRRQDQPLVAASGVNFPSLVDALESWFRYADDMGAFADLELDQDGPFQLSADGLLQSFETMFVVLRCYRGVESVTYLEDGATVTHSRVRFTDIPW